MSDDERGTHPTVTDEHITSLIDGKQYTVLRKHLTKHGYTPASYRAAFGLPDDYPMVSAAYSRRRSVLSSQNNHSDHWNPYKNKRRSDPEPA